MKNDPKSNPNAGDNAVHGAIGDATESGIGDPISRILSTDEQLVPSSGFLSSVMERVHEEAAAPPPIPFPWKRALPGIFLAVGVFGWGSVQVFRCLPQASQQLSTAAPHLPALALRDLTQVGWVAISLALALVSWLFAKRLAGAGAL
jgi:hypothetical protein